MTPEETAELDELTGRWIDWLPSRALWPAVGQRIRLLSPYPAAGHVAVVTGFKAIPRRPELGAVPVLQIESNRYSEGVLTNPREWEPAELTAALARIAHLQRLRQG